MDNAYLDLLKDILENGDTRTDRTQVGTLSVFGRQIRCNLADGFPLLTTKKVAWKAVVGELLWFLEGSSDERRLAEITHGTKDGTTTIWTPNALAPYWKPKAKFDGDLGRVYGVQWRDWTNMTLVQGGDYLSHPEGGTTVFDAKVLIEKYDQIKNIINTIKTNPTDRRMVLTAFNVGELSKMALPPCHMFAQIYVSKGKLSCLMYMRSVDVALGLPFNIASYALLTHMMAQVTDLGVGELIISMGDTHLYLDHLDGAKEQLTRSPLALPTLKLNPEIKDIDSFKMSDIELLNYQSHPTIKFKMAV